MSMVEAFGSIFCLIGIGLLFGSRQASRFLLKLAYENPDSKYYPTLDRGLRNLAVILVMAGAFFIIFLQNPFPYYGP